MLHIIVLLFVIMVNMLSINLTRRVFMNYIDLPASVKQKINFLLAHDKFSEALVLYKQYQ